MERSVTAGMGYIQTFIHPQVILTDDSSREDAFFTKAIRRKAFEIGTSVIELPKDAATNLLWITRLDSGSLAGVFTKTSSTIISAVAEKTYSLAHDLC